MPSNDRGIHVLTLLEIGSDELQWLQGDLAERERFARQALTALPGWFGAPRAGPNGASRYGWIVTEQGTSGQLRLQSIYATGTPPGLGTKTGNAIVPPRLGGVLPNGQAVEIKVGDNFTLDDANGDPVVVPDDATWHTLVAKYVTETFEPGVLQLVQNNGTVTGIWTDFTRYSDNTAPVPTIIRVDVAESANGNEGEYLVGTITDPFTMTITPAPPGADETVRFSVKGRFFSTPLGSVDAHLNGRLVWELRTRQTTIPADALIAYDVFRNTGSAPNVVLVDRRGANTFRRLPQKGDATTTRAVPALNVGGSPGAPVIAIDEALATGGIGAAAVLEADLAACLLTRITGSGTDANGMLITWVQADGVHAMRAQTAITQLANPSGPGGYAFEASALKVAQASITGYSLEPMQAGKGGWTHMIAYSSGGKIRIARSADNGGTFSALGVVWDPTIVSGAHLVHSPALLWTTGGRMILAAVYDTGGGSKTIRSISSDDYGDTWAVNGHAGTTILSGTSSPRDVELVQDGWSNIVGFYVEDQANDQLWTWTGTSPNNAAIDNDKATTANRGTKIHDSASLAFLGATLGQPRAVAYQDGTVAVAFAGVNATPAGRVALMHVRENEVQRLDTVASPDVVGYIGPANPVCAFGGANTGDAFLLYVDTSAGGDLYVRRYESHQLDTGAGWPGGR